MEEVAFDNAFKWCQPVSTEANQNEANPFEASFHACLCEMNDAKTQLDSISEISSQLNSISDISSQLNSISDISSQLNSISDISTQLNYISDIHTQPSMSDVSFHFSTVPSEIEANPFELAFDTFLHKPKINPRSGNRQAAARCRYKRQAQLEKAKQDLNQIRIANYQLETLLDELKNEKVHIQMILACHDCPLNSTF